MVLAEAFFLLAPALDLGPSGWFFNPARDFWLAENTALDRLRATFRLSIFMVGLPALLLLLLSVLRPARSTCGPRPFAAVRPSDRAAEMSLKKSRLK